MRREQLADLVDTALSDLWAQAADGGTVTGMALVAVGSHARREAGPASDLDLVLLHDARTHPLETVTTVANRLWYPLWDSGIRIDHAVRSVVECRQTAASDLVAAIGLLDLRPIAGDAGLALGTRELLRDQWRKGARTRVAAIVESLEERTETFGELAYLLEGDLKEARGGLRDAVVGQALVASWLVTAPSARQVAGATGTLLDVRDALQSITGRAGDRLLLAEQDAVAVALGLPDGDALLARVARAARTIRHSLTLALREARASTVRRRGLRRRQPPRLQTVEPGLAAHNGEIVLTSAAAPVSDPSIAVRAAAAAAWSGLDLSPVSALHLAQAELEPPEVWCPEGRDALLRLLGAGRNLVGVWETLDQAGLATVWFPEWDGIRNRPQRNAVHRHTVDRHSIETCVEASTLLDRVSRPDILALSALLHDIGKRPGALDHSLVGAPIAYRITARLGFGDADCRLVERLVREHLTLVELATRRDPDDPQTVHALLDAVDREESTLDLLRCLTEADARSAGPIAWTPWRARLVDDLVARGRAVLDGAGEVTRPGALTPAQDRLVALVRSDRTPRIEVGELDGGQSVTVVAPDRPGLFAQTAGLLAANGLAVRSALIRTVDGIAVDTWSVHGPTSADAAVLRTGLIRMQAGDEGILERLHRREASWRPARGALDPTSSGPRVMLVPAASAEATVLEVRALDRPALLHAVGRTLHELQVGVRSAHIATQAGRAVDVLYVTEAGGPDPGGRLSAARTGIVVGALMAAADWQPG